MKHLSDDELIHELKIRFNQSKIALNESKELMKILTEVNLKLEKSEALKGNFLSNIRNEVYNPLSSIIGLSRNIISSDNIDHETVKSFSTQIYYEAIELGYQMQNIYAAAEIEAGEVHPIISNVDVDQIIRTVIHSFEHSAIQKNVKLIYHFDSSGENGAKIFVKTDAEKLQTILSNLINNAIEFGPSNDIVIITLVLKDQNISISVENNGEGISEKDKKIIFERFTQLDTGSNKHRKGHGLGLSISKALVELLNGEIILKNRKNEGTVFIVSIPEWKTKICNELSMQENELFFEDSELF